MFRKGKDGREVVLDLIAEAAAVILGALSGSLIPDDKPLLLAVLLGLAVHGAFNNLFNAVLYMFSKDVPQMELEKAEFDKSDYVDRGYISRRRRLGHTENSTSEEWYSFTAWRFFSEYSAHMYIWLALHRYSDTATKLGSAARSARGADVDKGWDPRLSAKIGTVVFGLLGV